MLEWYRAGEDYTVLHEDCAALMRIAAATTQNPVWSYRARTLDTRLAPERLDVSAAFQRHLGIPLADFLDDPDGGQTRLSQAATRLGIAPRDDDTVSSLFSRLLTGIEPDLGRGSATVLDKYPASEAALARVVADDPRVAERFELYACGVELANGFGELTDAGEQRRRLVAQMDEKARIYGERYPIDEDFLAALAQMPPACGCALGFDRLVMLATGATRIDQVIWTPLAP